MPDGNGLALKITASGAKSWVLRFMLAGRPRKMGLGTFPAVGLAQAREAAEAAHKLLRVGIDPIESRKGAEAMQAAQEALRAAEAESQSSRTFRRMAEAYIAAHGRSWSAVHASQWPATLATYVFGTIGHLPVHEVTREHVLTILRPIWHDKAETASRVRGRIEKVLDFAAVDDATMPTNPARAAIITLKLGRQAVEVRHHPALPWGRLPEFVQALQEREASASAQALEFVILTAGRLSEVREATWREIDMDTATWTVPASRMKMHREHRVPLSDRAMEILNGRHTPGVGSHGYVFAGQKDQAPLSIMALDMILRRFSPVWKDRHGEPVTVHGFRSTFRDWCAEAKDTPRELAETALAHRVAGVEGAYQRGDMFLKRKLLMNEWAAYAASAPPKVFDARASWLKLGHVLP